MEKPPRRPKQTNSRQCFQNPAWIIYKTTECVNLTTSYIAYIECHIVYRIPSLASLDSSPFPFLLHTSPIESPSHKAATASCRSVGHPAQHTYTQYTRMWSKRNSKRVYQVMRGAITNYITSRSQNTNINHNLRVPYIYIYPAQHVEYAPRCECLCSKWTAQWHRAKPTEEDIHNTPKPPAARGSLAVSVEFWHTNQCFEASKKWVPSCRTIHDA